MPLPSSKGKARSGFGALELQVKLTWVSLFRTVATTLLLLILGVRLLSAGTPTELSPTDSASFVLIALVYVLTLAYGFVLRRGMAGRRSAYVQVLGDVLLATCLVYVTGGVESPFVFSFSLAVLAAALLLDRQGAVVAAVAASVSFVLLGIALQAGWIVSTSGGGPVPVSRFVFTLSAHILSQALLAVLAGYFASQLSSTGGKLFEREADLKELVELQNQIVNAMPSGLVTCEADGTLTFINPAAEQILGLTASARRPQRVDEILPGVQQLPTNRRAEMAIETPAGPKALGLSLTPLEGRSGSRLIVFQDLTDLRRMQDELRRIDHLASLGRVSAQLAHEVRNPLASMRGSAQILESDLKREPNQAKLARVIMRETDRLAGLVEGYLKLARPPPPVAEQVRIDRVVSETIEMLRADPSTAGIVVEQSLDPVTGRADVGQLRQVLINLLRNAFTAVGRGGTIRVSLEETATDSRIRVWDSAGAIPAEDLGRIFEPFYSTREGGTGLGLSTVHSIVRAHGGSIEVTSSKQHGTTFTVDLPKQPLAQA